MLESVIEKVHEIVIEETTSPQNTPDSTIDISNFKITKHTTPQQKRNSAGAMSIVCNPNSHRIEFSTELLSNIGNPKSIQVGISDDSILIGEKLGAVSQDTIYILKGKGDTIYSTQLVRSIARNFNIDFSTKTSYTLHSYQLEYLNGNRVALIKL
jgi:hypothetical protein